MKSTLTLLAATLSLALANLAQADSSTLVCIAGQTKADGTFAIVSGNAATVVVVTDTIALYSLKDMWSIYKTHYNIKNPFPMSLVTPYGAAGSYQLSGTALTAKWQLSDDGKQKMSGTFTADTSSLKGHIYTETDIDSSGNFTASSDDDVVCTLAGTQ